MARFGLTSYPDDTFTSVQSSTPRSSKTLLACLAGTGGEHTLWESADSKARKQSVAPLVCGGPRPRTSADKQDSTLFII